MLQGIASLVGIIVSLILAVERPGDGALKKQEVIGFVLTTIDHQSWLPSWVKALFTQEPFLDLLINMLVAQLKTRGILVADNLTPSPLTPLAVGGNGSGGLPGSPIPQG